MIGGCGDCKTLDQHSYCGLASSKVTNNGGKRNRTEIILASHRAVLELIYEPEDGSEHR